MRIDKLLFNAAPLAAALVLLCGGCGKQETVADKAAKSGTLLLGNGAEPKDLDPHVITGVPEARIVYALLEGLVSLDPATLNPVPAVAKSWDVSPDGKTYTFLLRDNSVWSDGSPVTASDFVYSFKRMLSPALGGEYAYMLFPLANAEKYQKGELKDFAQVGAKAEAPLTLKLTLERPVPYFLSLLAHHSWLPVQQKTIEKFGKMDEPGTLWTRPGNFVGNGPFTLKSWEMNKNVTLEKNPKYWDAAAVRLNGVVFSPIDNAQSEERAFRGGQLHVTETVPASKVKVYQDAKAPELRVSPYLGTYFYFVNCSRPPLDNPKVRRALAMAIDRGSLVRNVTQGGQAPAFNLTPPGAGGYLPEAKLKEDYKAARALLAEAGYPDGKGLRKIELLYNTSEGHKLVAQAIQRMWKQNLGVDVELVNKEWKVCLDAQNRRDYDISRGSWIGDYCDPNSFLDLWLTGGGNNRSGWSCPDYDKLIRAAAATTDPAARLALFQKAEAILVDQLPVIPIYFYTRVGLVHPDVQGWTPNLLDYHPLKHVYLQTRKPQ